ncbi:MAG: PH domain-containing protein [Methanobrevibacter sp.]|nr:PH domain-containing protein [Methanobrevibacter sp.]
MLFNRNDSRANERILYKTKPNMILGCKKAIYGFVLLAIVLIVSPMAIQFIGKMQVYLISQIKLPLTRYTAIAFFVVILIIILYIIWQLISWYSIEYTLTDSRIIIKSGVLSTKKTYMPYATIQDVNTSQNIIARLFNVGTVSVFSAYDNNEMELKNISSPSEVEEIIFSKIVNPRSFNPQPGRIDQYQQPQGGNYLDEDEYLGRNEFYDEFEPITPITHERNVSQRREYEYYPEDFPAEKEYPKYDYEPYNDRFTNNANRFVDDLQQNNAYSDDVHYNGVRDDYSYSNDNYYRDNGAQTYYNEGSKELSKNSSDSVDESSEKVIRRHFDKFKK